MGCPRIEKLLRHPCVRDLWLRRRAFSYRPIYPPLSGCTYHHRWSHPPIGRYPINIPYPASPSCPLGGQGSHLSKSGPESPFHAPREPWNIPYPASSSLHRPDRRRYHPGHGRRVSERTSDMGFPVLPVRTPTPGQGVSLLGPHQIYELSPLTLSHSPDGLRG